jgi:hypothetical protein
MKENDRPRNRDVVDGLVIPRDPKNEEGKEAKGLRLYPPRFEKVK